MPAPPASAADAALPAAPLIVALSGSLREGSHTLVATRRALDGAREAGARTDLLDLRLLRLPFRDETQHPGPEAEAAQRLRDAVRAADGVIVGSPEYHGSMSGALKNALDLLSSDELEGKMVGLCAVAGGAGMGSTLAHLRSVLRAVHAWVVPGEVMVAFAEDAFDAEGRARDPDVAIRLAHLGADVARYARMHRDARRGERT